MTLIHETLNRNTRTKEHTKMDNNQPTPSRAPHPGILIQGTLAPQDLIPAFLDALRTVHPASYDQVTLTSGHSVIPAHAMEDDDADWWYSEDASWVCSDLASVLDEHAAQVGLTFGPMETDPACWGFWVNMDAKS